MWKKIRHYFVTGLVALSPFFLTLFFVEYLIRLADHFVVNPLFQILPFDFDASFKIFLTKFVILIVVIIFVAGIGWTAEKFVFKKLFAAWEGFLDTIPLFNRIYGSIKEVAQAFFGDKTGVFKRVVFVEYPSKGIWSIGFMMQDKPWEIYEKTGREIVNVFLPHPPNPTSGFCIFVPREDIILSDMTVEEGVRLLISGGALVPPLKKK